MILTKRTGDLLDLGANGEVNVIVHQANLFHVFGAGIARQISQRFPYAYDADLHTKKGGLKKLGHFSMGIPPTIERPIKPAIVNLYSQEGLAPSHTNYNAMFDGLTELCNTLEPILTVGTIGFPYQMGCGLADGNWSVVEAIIKAVFEDSRFEIVIVKLLETK